MKRLGIPGYFSCHFPSTNGLWRMLRIEINRPMICHNELLQLRDIDLKGSEAYLIEFIFFLAPPGARK